MQLPAVDIKNSETFFMGGQLGQIFSALPKKCSDYYPFGLVMPGRSSNTGNPNDDYKFTGHELDDEAGLDIYHMNARAMDPVLGRFMQIDPHYFNYPGISPYAYVGNNPLVLVDPTGEDWYDINGTITWHDNEGDLTIEIDGENQTFTSLGKNVLVTYHARDEDGNEDLNAALHVFYLESNTEGATAAIEGGSVPAAIETMNTLAEGLYPAREQARSSKPGELALIINEGKDVPTTSGGTMNEVFFHRGNMGRNSLTTASGSPISAGCLTRIMH